MIREFRLPDLGEGLTESEILSWRVTEGQAVTLNQVIADVETAKAVVELPSPFEGVVARLHEAEGTVVEVGSPIISFDVPDAGGTPAPAAPAAGGAERRQPTLVGYGAEPDKAGRPARRARRGIAGAPGAPVAAPPAPVAAVAAPPAPAPAAAAPPAPAPVPAAAPVTDTQPPADTPAPERPRSTPPVRKLARDRGIDLATLDGTGPQGRILRSDVEAALLRSSGGPAGAAENT